METRRGSTFHLCSDHTFLLPNIHKIHHSINRIKSPDEMTHEFGFRETFARKNLLKAVAIGVYVYELQDGDAVASHGQREEFGDCREEYSCSMAPAFVALLNEVEVELEIRKKCFGNTVKASPSMTTNAICVDI
jgi:hypothetical protein